MGVGAGQRYFCGSFLPGHDDRGAPPPGLALDFLLFKTDQQLCISFVFRTTEETDTQDNNSRQKGNYEQ